MTTIYILEGYSTDMRSSDVRYRNYTTSQIKAEQFSKIPKIQFTDSGHGIVFSAREKRLTEKRKPIVRTLEKYVLENLNLIRAKE